MKHLKMDFLSVPEHAGLILCCDGVPVFKSQQMAGDQKLNLPVVVMDISVLMVAAMGMSVFAILAMTGGESHCSWRW